MPSPLERLVAWLKTKTPVKTRELLQLGPDFSCGKCEGFDVPDHHP